MVVYLFPFKFNKMKLTLLLTVICIATAFTISIPNDDQPKTEDKFEKLDKLQDALADLLEEYSLHHCKATDWLKCANIVRKCVEKCCAGSCITSQNCITCFGGLYERCKKCF